jgi:phosphate transport system permease protein
VLSSSYTVNWHVLTPGGTTIAANIANTWGASANDPLGQGALIASGLVLFGITLVVDVAARAIVRRSDRKAAP